MKIIHQPDLDQITFLDERFYLDTKKNLYFPAVTTILDVYPKGYGFQLWLKDLGSNADDVLKRASDQGTHVHEMIESFLAGKEVAWTEGEKDNYTLDEWLMFLKFADFYQVFKPETIAIERSMVDSDLGFGGTLDYVCKIKDEVWLIDWKSGAAIYKGNKIQISAYQKMWNKQEKEQINRIGCAHLRAQTKGQDKTGKVMQGKGWKIDEVEDPEHLYKLFEHAQDIWKEENPNPMPKNMVYPDKLSIDILKLSKSLDLEGGEENNGT
jgi:hypothetical protein